MSHALEQQRLIKKFQEHVHQVNIHSDAMLYELQDKKTSPARREFLATKYQDLHIAHKHMCIGLNEHYPATPEITWPWNNHESP